MKTKIVIASLVTSVMLTGCLEQPPVNKTEQAKKAAEAANSIKFNENAEIDNIKRRLELTSNPGQLGFIILLNEMGQPVLYTSVKGKVTSGSKRLTAPDRASSSWGGGNNTVVRASASDEGTWGSSGEYIFFWTVNDEYIQWNGKYMYSDKPFRLKTEPIAVLAVEPKK